MAIDPVCGMTVREDAAKGVSDYAGKRYYFCSTICKKKFDADPEKYLRQSLDPMAGRGHTPSPGIGQAARLNSRRPGRHDPPGPAHFGDDLRKLRGHRRKIPP